MTSTLKVQNIQHTNGTSGITIDSSGRVITQANPAFRAEKRASHQTVSDGITTKITFEHSAFDTGSNYDTTNSKYVIPISGIYHFDVLCRAIGDSSTLDFAILYLYVNGSHHTDIIQLNLAVNQLNNSHIGGSCTLSLTANDYVEIYGSISGSNVAFHKHDSGHRTWFSGFFVGGS